MLQKVVNFAILRPLKQVHRLNKHLKMLKSLEDTILMVIFGTVPLLNVCLESCDSAYVQQLLQRMNPL